MNAHVFSSSIDANGYHPQHKEPPRYIKVRTHYKKEKEFNRLFLAQELSGTKTRSENTGETAQANVPVSASKSLKDGCAIWATEFSRDGKYLAAAGRDHIVRVWAVISNSEERQAHEKQEDATSSSNNGHGERLNAPVFIGKPIREFEGHTMDVLDLSWSKNNFLLSSSMDKTVRLWHLSREECLCTFKHKDFVTSIAFHPRDDRFFLAGSLDSILRLWSIPDKTVAFWTQLPDLITAVAFTPDGRTAMAGVNTGLCLFYETEGLKYSTQIHVRSSRGRNAKGSKITGIRTMVWPPDADDGEVRLLITSNDSRIRIYNLKDKSLEMKFRGHENQCSQIRASFNDDGRYVICGSEDRQAYIWSTKPGEQEMKDKRPVEHFEAHSDLVTAAIFAPTKTRQLLSASGDPLYDLCNPPPVTLLSRVESSVSSQAQFDGAEKRHSDTMSEPKKPEESPAYIARTAHPNGNIIITADHAGNIKVFRQDCAYQKRRNDTWETSSTFSKKIGTIGRSGSIRSHNRSRGNSLSQTSLHHPSDRILSWRSSVISNSSIDSSLRGAFAPRSDRSVSPGRVIQNRSSQPSQTQIQAPTQNSNAKEARKQPYSNGPSTTTPSIATTSPPQSLYKDPGHGISQPPTPSFSLKSADDEMNPLRLDPNGRSHTFWNMEAWKRQASNAASVDQGDPTKLLVDGGPVQRGDSIVSVLSSEEGSYVDGVESEGEAMTCPRCGAGEFVQRGITSRQRLTCKKCGKVVD
jgi:WD40 repeat protein/ribosomal protein S27AE